MAGEYGRVGQHDDIEAQNHLRQCRICLDEENPNDMKDLIQPCHCKGSAGFVHRHCLDHWRASKRDPRAFTNCGICGFEYIIELAPQDEHAERQRLLRFRMLVARDTMAVFLGVQVVIIVLGLFVKALDTEGTIRGLFPTIVSDHEKTSYYICGVVLFFALLGLFGCIAGCLGMHRDPYVRDPCPTCYGCYCGDCNCAHGGGGGDDGKACLILLVAVIVILAFVGIFIGIFLATIVFQRIIQRHMRVLWLHEETKKYIVKDLFGQPDIVRGDGKEQPAAAQGQRAVTFVQPSAPEASYQSAPKQTFPPELFA